MRLVSPSRDSEAAEELRKALRAAGIDSPSLRQIERWTEDGLIPGAQRIRLGRKGTRAILAEQSVEQVKAVLEIRETHRPHYEIVLVLFVRGYEIEAAKLKAAYLATFDAYRRYVHKLSTAADPEDIADQAGDLLARRARRSKDGRAFRRRIEKKYGNTNDRKYSESPSELLRSVMTSMILAIQGQHLEPDALIELATATGFDSAWEENIAGLGPLVAEAPIYELQDAAASVELDFLSEAITTASLSDLLNARDVVCLLTDFAKEFDHYLTRVDKQAKGSGLACLSNADELAIAMSTAALVAVGQLLRTSVSPQDLDFLPSEIERLRVLNRVLDGLPKKWWPFLARQEYAELLDEHEQQEIKALVTKMAETDPAIAAVLDNTTE